MVSFKNQPENQPNRIKEVPEVLKELWFNYQELFVKTAEVMDDHPETYQRFKLIHRDLVKLNGQIEELIVDLDRQRFNLSDQEKQRLADCEESDRLLEQLKPWVVLTMLKDQQQPTE